MRIALLTEGVITNPERDGRMWCDRLVRQLPCQDFTVYALPPAGLGAPSADRGPHGRAARHAVLDAYRELTAGLAGRAPGAESQEDRFASGLHRLAELSAAHGGLSRVLRAESAVRALESAVRTPAAAATAGPVRARDVVVAAAWLERALRPLSAPWCDERALGRADLCHAASGGPVALPGLLAARLWGVPLLVSEYTVPLREHHLGAAGHRLPPLPRVLAARFHRLLATEVYRCATALTASTTGVRRWQERLGACRARTTTVPPVVDAEALRPAGEAAESAAPDPGDLTLVWSGAVEPAKDLACLLHAFARIREAVPHARLRLVSRGPCDPDYLARCQALARRLFPCVEGSDEGSAAGFVEGSPGPVTFEGIGSGPLPTAADAFGSGGIAVLSSAVEDFPVTLAEAMLCGRATVSTDTGAVREVVGGTGLVVPPGDPRALAEACVDLLRDPARRARLGAAARARALELFTAERGAAAFHGIYLDLTAHRPPWRGATAVPFARSAGDRPPGEWTGRPGQRHLPRWAAGDPDHAPLPVPAASGSRSERA